jgi:hypothetical protein
MSALDEDIAKMEETANSYEIAVTAQVSMAISLKRIADTLEAALQKHLEEKAAEIRDKRL